MKIFSQMSVKTKLITVLTGIVAIIFTFTIVFIAINARNNAMQTAKDLAQSKAGEYSQQISAFLNNAMAYTRATAHSIEGLKKGNVTHREAYIELMRRVMERNPEMLAFWILCEPNVIDNADSSYKNTTGHDETGRFIVGMNRAKGKIEIDAAVDYEKEGDGDYYLIPKRTGKETVNEPYQYAYTSAPEITFFETSLVVPFFMDNNFAGVMGIDVDLNTLIQLSKQIKVYDNGYGCLISYQGNSLSHPDEKLIGQPHPLVAENPDLLKKIQQAENFSLQAKDSHLKQDVLYYFQPVTIGKTGTPWSFCMAVPVNEALAQANQLFYKALIIGIIGLIILGIIIFFLANALTRPILSGIDFAKKIADGNLNTTIQETSQDEIGQLINSLNQMAGKLKTMVETIQDGAHNIVNASQEISKGSQQLSQGASHQASSAEEVSTSMEQMFSNIQQNTDNAQKTEHISRKISEGIHVFSDSAKQSLNSVKLIADKITIINDIAFQTNLLSLNAAVEAARAGEHGKGFAVVAAEVRKLAERSKIAAEEISKISKDSLKAIKDSQTMMDELFPEIQKSMQLVNEISSASMEQTSGVQLVNNAIQDLNKVIQQNAAFSEEIATNAEELASQSEQLKEAVMYFKIN